MHLDDFDAFFADVNDGQTPFAWQRRLCQVIAEEGRWPGQIVAPTGTGKSNVVDVHVFLNALHAAGAGPRVPRRLAVVVNRRALVDQHWERATRIASLIEKAHTGLLAEIANRLRGLCGRDDVHAHSGDATDLAEPLLITSLRGGVRPGAEWIGDPRACAVIAATPDMWGSRLLFRGYGATPYARPREAGLLAVDSVMVLDESHLNRQLLVTACDVATTSAQECQTLGVPPLNVVATTATPTDVSGTRVGVTQEDVDGDEVLRKRLLTRKPLRLHPSGHWPTGTKASESYVKELADLAEQLSDRANDSEMASPTVGCVVNNVDTAVRLTELLRRRQPREGAVVAWVGRLRPIDLAETRDKHPGLFTVRGDPSVDFLVATQTVEVGVDIDLAAMVTELAPGAGLTQRAGRVNRLGLRSSGPVVVVTPSDAVTRDRPPYRASELDNSRLWLHERERDDLGLAPWTLAARPAPLESPTRHAFSHLYPGDWCVLAETSGDPFAETDLDFWLRDDLTVQTEPVGIVVRAPLPADTAAAVELLRACPVLSDEVFPAVIGDAQRLAEGILASEESTARIFLDRAGELSMLIEHADARPGDTLVVDACHSLTREGVVTGEPPSQAEVHRTLWPNTTEQALAEPDFLGSVVVGGATNRLGAELLAMAVDEDPPELSRLVSDVAGKQVDVRVYPESREPAEEPAWMAIRPIDDVVAEPEVRQEMVQGPEAVPLDRHQSNVARLARRMGAELGLHPEIVAALAVAALHHDDGKADTRFQRALGAPADRLLAKSGHRSWFERRRAWDRSALPPKWRHEQLSVAVAHAHSDQVSELALRLIGTSHGRGRPFFPHGPTTLVGHVDRAGVLGEVRIFFEAGSGWSDLLDATHEQYGTWGCAYLEAVLRSADARVSGDGS